LEPLLIGNSPVAARSCERMSLHLPGLRHTLQAQHLRPRWHLPRRNLGRRQNLGYLEGGVLALASCCLMLTYKVAISPPSTECYAINGTLFPTSGGRPALSVPSPAAISLLLTSLVTTPGPLVGPARPPCNYPLGGLPVEMGNNPELDVDQVRNAAGWVDV
jgi:hypothetical protein